MSIWLVGAVASLLGRVDFDPAGSYELQSLTKAIAFATTLEAREIADDEQAYGKWAPIGGCSIVEGADYVYSLTSAYLREEEKAYRFREEYGTHRGRAPPTV